MATDDGLLLYLSRLLSRRKSSRSLLKQCETKIYLKERFLRKRKLKFLVLLALVIGHSTVERTIWQKQRTSAWFYSVCDKCRLQTCRLADLQTCRLADLQTCRPADLQTCRLADSTYWPLPIHFRNSIV